VRPLLARYRERRGLSADPVTAFRDGGYAEQRIAERGIASIESAYEQG
jgi:L-rhamnose isomerase